MIRLSANLSKKVPLPGIDYSSQQYGASVEIEVSDADKPDAIRARIRDLYTMLSSAIDEQISAVPQPALPAAAQAQRGYNGNGNGHTLPPPQPVQEPMPPVRNGYALGRNRVAATNGNGSARRGSASEAQCRAIFAICKSQGIEMLSVLADFNVADPKDLNIKDASRLIDQLKNGTPAQ